ncbi:unnamed protein product, partial [Nesidiocoris tenuis]
MDIWDSKLNCNFFLQVPPTPDTMILIIENRSKESCQTTEPNHFCTASAFGLDNVCNLYLSAFWMPPSS